jgi:hypothetical protein
MVSYKYSHEGELPYEHFNYSPNIRGMGVGIAHHLYSTDPKEWETFKADAIAIIRLLHGSGEKDLCWTGIKDSKQYFDALHELADNLRK